MSSSGRVYLIPEDITSLAEEFKPLSLGNYNRMICQLIFQIACGRIGLQLGEYVPDSGQEHTADSDNRFFVTTASLDSAIAFFAFRVLVRLDYSVSDLYQQRF